jgi:hypothetical protein
MPLTEQEKQGLVQQLAILLEANEPEAMLATLGRVCDRKALEGAQSNPMRQMSEREADRWRALSQSCQNVAQELERINAPRSAQTPENAASA